jgi:hypothetical protein
MHMNLLHIGFKKNIALPKGSFPFIHDDVPDHPKGQDFRSAEALI